MSARNNVGEGRNEDGDVYQEQEREDTYEIQSRDSHVPIHHHFRRDSYRTNLNLYRTDTEISPQPKLAIALRETPAIENCSFFARTFWMPG